jgi:ribosome-binding protein aMBF1 (putative translation factor)
MWPRVKQALDAKGIRSSDLARLLGISPQALSQAKNGHHPGMGYVPAMAEALGVPVGWLTTGAAHLAPPWATDPGVDAWNALIIDAQRGLQPGDQPDVLLPEFPTRAQVGQVLALGARGRGRPYSSDEQDAIWRGWEAAIKPHLAQADLAARLAEYEAKIRALEHDKAQDQATILRLNREIDALSAAARPQRPNRFSETLSPTEAAQLRADMASHGLKETDSGHRLQPVGVEEP